MKNSKNPITDTIVSMLLGDLKDPKNTVLGFPSMFDLIKETDMVKPMEGVNTLTLPESTVYIIDIPGVATSDVQVTIENNAIQVTADRYGRKLITDNLGNEKEETVKIYTYQHNITLKDNADVTKVNATHRDGVLTINVPMKDEAKPRTIIVDNV